MSLWDFVSFVVIGFAAQIVDGALGMAYGVTATTLLLSLGTPPAVASATVHLAECVTTGVSGVSHHAFGNVDRVLFRRLIIPGVVGAWVCGRMPTRGLMIGVGLLIIALSLRSLLE